MDRTSTYTYGINFYNITFDGKLFSDYLDSCTRLMPERPASLANLNDPTVTKLRALARRSYFVGPDGRQGATRTIYGN